MALPVLCVPCSLEAVRGPVLDMRTDTSGVGATIASCGRDDVVRYRFKEEREQRQTFCLKRKARIRP